MKIRTGLISIACAFAIQPILLAFNLYDRWEWIDVPMHMIGGFVVAILAAGIIHHYQLNQKPWFFTLLFSVSFVIFIGAGWELCEYLIGFILSSDIIGLLTVRDLLGDLFNDSLGAILAWLIFIRK